MKKNKYETAKALAKAHAEVEQNLKFVFLIQPHNDQDPNDPIKLLEVVDGTIERGIEPIGFTADSSHEIDYPSVIVEISPNEYQKYKKDGKLNFDNWTIGEELWPIDRR